MKRSDRFIVLFVAVVFSVICAVPALGAESLAQAVKSGKAKSYVVIMANDPAISYTGNISGLEATKPGKGGKINPNSAHVRKYQNFLKASHGDSLARAGVDSAAKINTYTIALNGYSAILTGDQAAAVKAQKDVVLVLEDQMRYPDTEAVGEYMDLYVFEGPYDKGFDGEGVVVGVIDSGIWPEHPSFADDGSFDPPANLPLDDSRPNCEFGNMAHNPNDVPFACNNKLIGARQMADTYRLLIGATPDEYDSARDDNGHGTHTASTAAGNSGVHASVYGIPRGTISGIAPRAYVIAYKGLGDLGGFTSDLAASIDQAVADGVDVINYSIGGGAASPGADELAFLFAADSGVFAATSAGNSGPGAGTLGNPGTMPWITTVGASTQDRFFLGTTTLGNGDTYAGASLTPGVASAPLVDAEFAGGDLCIPGTLNPGMVAGKIVLCRRGAIARADKSRAVLMAGGAGMILYNNNDVDTLFSDTHWVPSVHMDNTPGLAIKAYIAGDPAGTALITGNLLDIWDPAPSMAYFSSRGPNVVATDIIKPDITATGVQVLAGYSPTPIGGVPGQLFAAISGTSMSSPVIAGVAALLTQANPEWSPAVTRSAMMTTALQDVVDNDRVSLADPFDYGAGHVNPGGTWDKGSITQPGLAYEAGFFDYLGFLCDAFPETFSDPAGTCAFLDSIGVPTDARSLNLPSIGIDGVAGTYTVKRTVTSVAKENGWRSYDVSVEAPPGYSVMVEPSSIRLKRGQSADYYVTLTNDSAPLGEWRFGALTWHEKNGEYEVYSPIAVRGILFHAPAKIEGSGETGSASFDVSFGYTGSYAAAPHGPEPAVVTSDSVVQDPDQSFDPGDGYSNPHQFNLAGAAYFQVAVPPDATAAGVDLDLFVYDPNGNFVASSTSGGTDELIEIALPMDGIWTVWVHGWNTQGPSANYDMYSWAISLTPGGNMTVDSAPASATLGTQGTVDVSWTGATAGQWHLGAVSHTGDIGLMGLTLVDVDNR